PARSAMSSIAAAWYPWDTNTSSAASSSCRRRSCRGSLLLRGLVSGVAVTIPSPVNSVSGVVARGHYFRVRPHTKLRSAVIVIVEADGALLFRSVRLVDVERDLAACGRYGLVRDHVLVLLDGVALGRLHVQLAQGPGPLFLLVGTCCGTSGSRQLPERCLQCFPVGREGMHHVGEDRDGNLGPDGEGNLAHPAGRVRPH